MPRGTKGDGDERPGVYGSKGKKRKKEARITNEQWQTQEDKRAEAKSERGEMKREANKAQNRNYGGNAKNDTRKYRYITRRTAGVAKEREMVMMGVKVEGGQRALNVFEFAIRLTVQLRRNCFRFSINSKRDPQQTRYSVTASNACTVPRQRDKRGCVLLTAHFEFENPRDRVNSAFQLADILSW